MNYQITKAPSFLYGIGVRYYETGVLHKNGIRLFDYYKVDSVSANQKADILKWCKDARFFNSAKEYAPELKSVMICFPKSGFYKHGFSD